MTTPHQVNTYNELQGARPCVGRGELILNTKHHPATPCCKANDVVESVKFYCTILNRTYNEINVCWTCTKRKTQDDIIQ